MGTISNRNSESAESGIWITVAHRKMKYLTSFFSQQGVPLSEHNLIDIVDEIRRNKYRPVRQINDRTKEFAYWIGSTRILIRVTVKGNPEDGPECNLKWIVSRFVIHHAKPVSRCSKQVWPQRRNPVAYRQYCHS